MATIGYLGADGTTIPAGLTEVVDCAGTTDPNADAGALASDALLSGSPSGETRCTFTEEGLIAVEGEGITAAYVAVAGAEFDVRPAGYFAPRRVQPMRATSGVDPRIAASGNTCSFPTLDRNCYLGACPRPGRQQGSGPLVSGNDLSEVVRTQKTASKHLDEVGPHGSAAENHLGAVV